MASNQKGVQEARLRAQEKFAKAEKRDREALKEKDRAFAAAISKSARLRALRLAKEASDKAAAERKAAEKKPAKRARRSAP